MGKIHHLKKSAFVWPLILIAFSWVIVNSVFPEKDVVKEPRINKDTITVGERNLLYKEEVQTDFYNFKSHYNYINSHFDTPTSWKDSKGIWHFRDDGQIFLTYRGYLTSQDSTVVDIGNLGLAFCYYRLALFETAEKYFSKTKNAQLRYASYLHGILYYKQGKLKKAIPCFEKELSLSEELDAIIFPLLIKIYKVENKESELLLLVENERSKYFVGDRISNNLYFKNRLWYKYLGLLYKTFTEKVNFAGFSAALLICIIWSIYLLKLNVFKDGKDYLFFSSLVLGMVFSFGTSFLSDYNKIILGNSLNGDYLNDLVYSILGIGLIEEFVKIVPIFLLFLTGRLKQPYEYILYACASALGFAFIENLLYFDERIGNGIIHGRALTAVIGHMADSSLAAYGLVLSRFKYKPQYTFLVFPSFLIIAAVSHGLYDYWIFRNLYLIFVPFFLFTTTVWVVMINNSLNNSSNFNYKVSFSPASVQLFLTVSLTLVLVVEYGIAGWKHGPQQANISLLAATISGSFFVLFFAFRFNKIDLVPQYWKPIKWRNQNLDSSDDFTNFIRLITSPFSANSIVDQNFVSSTVVLRSSSHNRELKPYLRGEINGLIIKRVTLHYSSGGNKPLPDPLWFVVKLENSLLLNTQACEYILIKFRDNKPNLEKQTELFVHLKAVPILTNLDAPSLFEASFRSFGWAILSKKDSPLL